MLIVEPRHDRVLYNSVANSQVGLDRNLVQVDGLETNFRYFRNRGIQSKHVGYPDLPYIFNIDKYLQHTIVLQGSTDAVIPEQVLNNIIESYTNEIEREVEQDHSHLVYLRLYAYDWCALDNYFEHKEDWETHAEDNIASLYNKTMTDMVSRDSLFGIPNIGARVYTHTDYNFLIEVVNYDDYEQASDYFLTLGIIPMVFPEIKEKLSEKELKYFKELVRRSQVKRIRNVEATNFYYDFTTSDKYRDAMKDFRFKTELENLLRQRRRVFEVRLNEAIREKDQLMNRFQDLLGDINKYQVQLGQLENDDQFKQEVELVMNMQPMRDFQVHNNQISMTIVTNLEYYDPELLDITLTRNTNSYDDEMTNKFFRDVFVDEKYEYYVGQVYPFRLDEERISLPAQITYNIDTSAQHCLYNPHIHYYHCYGSNEPEIMKAHKDKDLVGYVNAVVSSLKNVNFADSAVFSRWYRSIRALLYGETYDQYDITDYIRTAFLKDKETGEFISLEEYARRYRAERRLEAEFTENPDDIEPTELDVHDTVNGDDYEEDEEEMEW